MSQSSARRVQEARRAGRAEGVTGTAAAAGTDEEHRAGDEETGAGEDADGRAGTTGEVAARATEA